MQDTTFSVQKVLDNTLLHLLPHELIILIRYGWNVLFLLLNCYPKFLDRIYRHIDIRLKEFSSCYSSLKYVHSNPILDGFNLCLCRHQTCSQTNHLYLDTIWSFDVYLHYFSLLLLLFKLQICSWAWKFTLRLIRSRPIKWLIICCWDLCRNFIAKSNCANVFVMSMEWKEILHWLFLLFIFNAILCECDDYLCLFEYSWCDMGQSLNISGKRYSEDEVKI